jgi:dissimilatory sulfite reductase (desulfoviridin) alpha/beta subunit
LESCKIVGDWYSKNGYKYKKYKDSIEFIKRHGYKEFLEWAEQWSGAYGKLD